MESNREFLQQELKEILAAIVEHDTDYDNRNRLTWAAMHKASMLGFPVGIRIDPDEPEWPVAYIELPTGQVSWHTPQHEKDWDGHTTEHKFMRIGAYLDDNS